MQDKGNIARGHPARWVPTLYFAEGVPFFAVSLIAGILYKRMGLSNATIAFYTSWLLLPWSLKPLWSPLLEMYKTKKFFVVLLQFAGGLSLALIALALPLSNCFRYTIALFAVVAFCSSTHDIAADGLYIASLSARQQAAYAGWQGAFFNGAKFLSLGGLVILAGFLEQRIGAPAAWATVFGLLGALLAGLGLYHAWALPGTVASAAGASVRGTVDVLVDVVRAFFAKPGIWMGIGCILLFRLAEGQVQTSGPLFLRDARAIGGLGLSTQEVGAM